MSNSPLERQFLDLWASLYPTTKLHQEVEIIPGRKFRFDFIHAQSRVAVEINGGTYAKHSSHASGVGLDRDYSKNNLAISQGWIVFCLSSKMITPDWLDLIYSTIHERTQNLVIPHD